MLEAGKKFRHLVQFDSGAPTSDFTYTLYNQDGDIVTTQTVPLSQGQLSYVITISAEDNTISKPLFEQMTLEWEYDTATEAVNESITYSIRLPIGFPVSIKGVRDLLGVDQEELPDEEIDLFDGFLQFRTMVGEETDLVSYQNSGDFDSYKITKGIEALTALSLLPSLQIRLPKKYDSGTSSYERWTSIDWEALQMELLGKVGVAVGLLVDDNDLYPIIDIFTLSDPGVDAITGA